MRSTNCATLVLTALVLVLQAARAQTVALPATFTAFSVQSLNDGGYSEPGTLVLLSDTAGETVFALPHLDSRLDVESGGVADNAEYLALLGFVPRAGYVITGFTLSGTLTGTLELGIPPYGTVTFPGGARNAADFGLNRQGQSDVRYTDIDGTRAFSLSKDGGSSYLLPNGVLGLDVAIWAFLHADADYTYYSWSQDGQWYDSTTPSYAALAVADARLAVSWAPLPVPEPYAWMMLAAGLVPLAAWRGKSSHGPGYKRGARRVSA